MIKLRQCLFLIPPFKHHLWLLAICCSLGTSIYAQGPACITDITFDLQGGDTRVLNADEFIPDADEEPTSTYRFVLGSSNFGTESADVGDGTFEDLTITCDDIATASKSVMVRAIRTTAAIPTPDEGDCTSNVTIEDVTGPVVTGGCSTLPGDDGSGSDTANDNMVTVNTDADECFSTQTIMVNPATDNCNGDYTATIDFMDAGMVDLVYSSADGDFNDPADMLPPIDQIAIDVSIQFPEGSNVFSIIYTDGNAATTTCGPYNVAVADNQAPTFESCPDPSPDAAFTFTADANCKYTYIDSPTDAIADLVPEVDDNCQSILTYSLTGSTTATNQPSSDFLLGVTFNSGTTTVTWTLTDPAGNDAVTMCAYDVVVEDNTAPTVDCTVFTKLDAVTNSTADCSRNLTQADSETILFPYLGGDDDSDASTPDLPAAFSDNCENDGANVTISASYFPANDMTATEVTTPITTPQDFDGDNFPLGTTTVTLTFNDSNNASATNGGNTTTCTFDVVITDGQAPVLDNAALGSTIFDFSADADNCGYTVNGGELDQTATDDCDDTPTITYTVGGQDFTTLAGYMFPKGNTPVSVVAADDVPNTSTPVTFIVQVNDMTDPVAGPNFLPTDELADVAMQAATQGVQVILETTTDAEMCEVTEVADLVPTDFSDNCDANANITIQYTVAGGPNGMPAMTRSDLSMIDFEVTFNAGTLTPYTLTYALVDDSGNTTADEADQTPYGPVEVIVLDKTNPVASFAPMFMDVLDANGAAVIDAAELIAYTEDDPNTAADETESFADFSNNCTSDEAAGFTSITDNCGAVVVYYSIVAPATMTDPVPPDCAAYEKSRTYNCKNLGTFDVQVTVSDFAYAIDANGAPVLTPNTISGTVPVTIKDDIDPMITCPATPPAQVLDATTDMDNDCDLEYALALPTFSDNTNDNAAPVEDDECGLTLEFSINDGTFSPVVVDPISTPPTMTLEFPAGMTKVTYRVKDGSDNEAECDVTVTVNDAVPPTFVSCPDDLTVAINTDQTTTDACVYSYSGLTLVPTVEENCPGDLDLNFSITGITGTEMVTDSDGNTINMGTATDVNVFINGLNFTPGDYTIEWTVADAATPPNMAATNCSYTITVEDQTAPVIDCSVLSNIEVKTDDATTFNCTANLEIADYSDNQNAIFGLANPDGDPATDDDIPAALSDNCTANNAITVTATFILGNEDPVDVGPMDGIPDNQMSAMATGAFPDLTSFAFPLGTTTITLSFDDNSGDDVMDTKTCTIDVVVTDGVAPVIPAANCPGNAAQVTAADGCTYTAGTEFDIAVADVTEDCDDMVTITYSVINPDNSNSGDLTTLEGYQFALGSSQVSIVATDDADNASAPCQFVVSVTDETAPVVTDPADEDGNAPDIQVAIGTASDATECSILGSAVPAPTFTENCGTAPSDPVLTYEVDGIILNAMQFAMQEFTVAGSPFDITYIVTDGSGNEGKSSPFELIVVDETAPVITACSDAAGNLDANGELTINAVDLGVVAEDNCGSVTDPYFIVDGAQVTSVTYTCKDLGAPISLLVYVADMALDVAGNAAPNQSEGCSVTVTITDNIDPTITCPANIDLVANENCEGMTALPTPAGVDNTNDDDSVDTDDDEDCPLTYQFSTDGTNFMDYTADMQTFPLGMTTVTYQVTDASGNTGTCTFEVNVVDNSTPALVCPTDNFTFDIADDADPNVCGFVNDVAATNGIAEVTATGTCTSGDVTLSYAITFDGATNTVSSLDGVTFAVGTTSVVATATIDDDSDDSTPEAAIAGDCTFTVTITDDNAATFTCPEDIMIASQEGDTGCGTRVDYTPPSVPGGACDAAGGEVVLTAGIASGEVFPVGTTTVTYELRDANGATTDVCSFDVTVTDGTAPTADVANQTVTAGQGCAFTIVGTGFDPTNVQDNCGGIVTQTYTITDAMGNVIQADGEESLSGEILPLGENIVVYTFDDDDNLNDAIPGNQSTRMFTITVNPPVSTFSLNATVNSIGEGDSGASTVTFTVSRLQATASCPASVEYMSMPGTATAGVDYTMTPGTLDFNAGQSTATFTINIVGDTEVEDDETFTVLIKNPSAPNEIGTASLVFTIIDNDEPLAVDWVNFTAKKTANDAVELNWEVANEDNTAHFTVERSTDGVTFTAIGETVASKAVNYTFVDNKPFSGVNYYRLREVATDGSFELSNTASVQLTLSQEVSVYPNPTTGKVTIASNQADWKIDRVVIYDAVGKVISLMDNNVTSEVDLSNLVPGLYFIQVEVAGEKYMERVVKE